MAKGNEIIVSSDPKGVFLEGIISGTPVPGQICEIKVTATLTSGRPTWQATTRQPGTPQLVAVLLPDSLQGKLATDAYVTGTRCFLYAPAAGEELNVLLDYEPGTGTSSTDQIGELLEVNNYGKVQAFGSITGRKAAFTLMENMDASFTTDQLVHVMFNGH